MLYKNIPVTWLILFWVSLLRVDLDENRMCCLCQVNGVKSYGMDKLMVGSTMLNTVLMSTDYYVDQYLPPGEGTSHLSTSYLSTS